MSRLYLIQGQGQQVESLLQSLSHVYEREHDALMLLAESVVALPLVCELSSVFQRIYILHDDSLMLPSAFLNTLDSQVHIIDYTQWAELILTFNVVRWVG